MLGYTCKYTPIELLEALGARPVPLNREAGDFQYAEGLTHSHFCCHVKAVLEECRRTGLRELVLVNCCDSVRRAYDVLLDQGELDFLFLLDLPHHAGGCARAMLRGELERLERAYGAYRGTAFDPAAFRAAFRPAPALPEGPFLAVAGARAGEGLLSGLRAASPLPVADLTCGGNRALPPPGDAGDRAALLDRYAGALLEQLPCMRMDEIGRREALLDHPGLRGVIYHTVKFCDYYAFEYETLRRRAALPLLKVESDFTRQAGGQLSTRLDAFLEQLDLGSAPGAGRVRPGRYVAGIDSGSTTTNVVVLDLQGNVAASAVVRTGPRASAGAERAFAALGGFTPEDMAAVVATGYGRQSIPFATGQVTEITCHARGAHRLNPEARSVVDIGGQDSKVICLDAAGGVKNFVMNDKCAAGTGRFLELMARTLEVDLQALGRLGLSWTRELTISSVCTVFAESEVVSLIADNHGAQDIVHALNQAVASKTAALAQRAGGTAPYMMTGGVARNPGVVRALEEKLGAPMWIAPDPDLCGALGAALFALDAAGG